MPSETLSDSPLRDTTPHTGAQHYYLNISFKYTTNNHLDESHLPLAISTMNINEIAKKNSGKNDLEGTVVSVLATPKATTKGTECSHNLN